MFRKRENPSARHRAWLAVLPYWKDVTDAFRHYLELMEGMPAPSQLTEKEIAALYPEAKHFIDTGIRFFALDPRDLKSADMLTKCLKRFLFTPDPRPMEDALNAHHCSEWEELFDTTITTLTASEQRFRAIAARIKKRLEEEHRMDLAEHYTIIGDTFTIPTIYEGRTEPLATNEDERVHHTFVIGRTGSGKSTLLTHLIKQDLDKGHGLIVISPENDLYNGLENLDSKTRSTWGGKSGTIRAYEKTIHPQTESAHCA